MEGWGKLGIFFLTKKIGQFLFLVCCNCPKACLKLEVNKPQTFIAHFREDTTRKAKENTTQTIF